MTGRAGRQDEMIAGVVDDLRRVFQVVHGHSKRAERVGGLTGPQLLAIKVLSEATPIRVSDLARRMYLHPSTVVGILDRLASRGLVERTRSAEDRRVVAVTLSDRGKELVAEVPEVAQGLLLSGLERLSPGDRKTVSEGLRIVVELLGAERMPPRLLFSPEVNVPAGLRDEGDHPAGETSSVASVPGIGRLWIFDFDGTLSPIVPDRAAARLHPACRAALRDLARRPGELVAVLSSRTVEDLAPRVPVEGVILGGNSGLEWLFPGGHRVRPGSRAEERLAASRRRTDRLFAPLAAVPGVEIEDKRWSAAVHFRRVSPDALSTVHSLIGALKNQPGIRVYDGPLAVEVQFLPSVSKAYGIRRLCRILGVHPSRQSIICAGDDENDAKAMLWLLDRGGTAIAVGDRIRMRGIVRVAGPVQLARAVREMMEEIRPSCSE